jgi:glutathione S-transferase
MKLYYHPMSPFVRKVMITAHENGILDRIRIVPGDTSDEALRAVNPLCKIPTLVLEDGTALYDSRVICEYLDALGHGLLIPANGHDRLRCRLLEALGDGIADAVLRISYEMKRPEGERHGDVVERCLKAVRAGIREAERLVDPERFTLGEASVAAALVYVDARLPTEHWRISCPALAAWFAAAGQRASVAGTAPEALA